MKTYELMPEEAMIYATSTPKALNLNLYEEDGVPTRMDVKGVVRYMGNLIDFFKDKANRLETENRQLRAQLDRLTKVVGGSRNG